MGTPFNALVFPGGAEIGLEARSSLGCCREIQPIFHPIIRRKYSSKRTIATYATGVNSRENKAEAVRPEARVKAKGTQVDDPVPRSNSIGSAPQMVARVVMRIGRRRL
jgi:hypothetical protein